MKPANFSPVYACLYPQLAEIARSHGYSMAVHGSMSRDFDLICIPWTDNCASPEGVVATILGMYDLKQRGEPKIMEHGRISYLLAVKFGECFIDLSFMPRIKKEMP